MAKPSERTHPNRNAFPQGLSGPALRALAAARIPSIAALAAWTEQDLSALHGMGPTAIARLREALRSAGHDFRAP